MFSISDYLNFSECDTSDSDFVENNSQEIIGKGEGGNRTTGRGTGAASGAGSGSSFSGKLDSNRIVVRVHQK